MNTINIKIEFNNEDRQILEGLTGAITLLASVMGNAQPQEVQERIIAEATKDGLVKAESPAPAIEEPKEETPAPVAAPIIISLAEFQKAITLAVSKGAEAKKAVKDIINKYAPSVSAVPEDKRADVIAELANI